MKDKPILMSAPMVRAILEGRKTQTRRIVKPQPELQESFSHIKPPEGPRTSYGWSCWYPSHIHPKGLHYDSESHLRKGLPVDFCPYGKPGDRLWVREAMRITDILRYDADQAPVPNIPAGWENVARRPHVTSMFMPRWASRITLEITEVRVQRLQEISESDAIDEGTGVWLETNQRLGRDGNPDGYRKAYRELWDEINGKKHPWESNPWVWAVTFRRITPP